MRERGGVNNEASDKTGSIVLCSFYSIHGIYDNTNFSPLIIIKACSLHMSKSFVIWRGYLYVLI